MAGERFVYFHGQPGSPLELRLCGLEGWLASPELFAPDRGHERRELPLEPYMEHLVEGVVRRFPEGPLRLVGFSLGGFVAVEVALRLAERGRDLRLDLVSAATPLGLGHFLPHMAGGLVFDLAARRPRLFGLLTSLQGGLSRAAPGLLFDQLFRTATGRDAELVADPALRRTLQAMVGRSLRGGARGYRREIVGYVAQDVERPSRLDAPVTLWQGDADNWTPPGMAEAFAAVRPEVRTVRTLPGLSHYSTLRAALPEILGRPPVPHVAGTA
jgi:pimeloyl-ACP methyl ester carboxylesterase